MMARLRVQARLQILAALLSTLAGAQAQTCAGASQQCGGMLLCGVDVQCFCCVKGYFCSRSNAYWWDCQVMAPPPPVTPKPIIPLITGGTYDYKQVLDLSFRFYEAQRAGKLPSTTAARVPWRVSAFLQDKRPDGKPMAAATGSAGYFDAGDYVRFMFPQAYAVSHLAWAVSEFTPAFSNATLLQSAKDAVKWGTDFILNLIVDNTTLIAQVGNGNVDHARWMKPQDVLDVSPMYTINKTRPGSDLAGAMSAALAAAARVLNTSSPYGKQCIAAASTLYRFGVNYTAYYQKSVTDAGNFYNSGSLRDDLSWAALQLYLATSNKAYLNESIRLWDYWYSREEYKTTSAPAFPSTSCRPGWDSAGFSAAVVLARITGSTKYSTMLDRFFAAFLQGTNGTTYTPKGLAYVCDWGSLRHTANAAFLALAYSRTSLGARNAKLYTCWAHSQLRYMLGSSGRSFVVGYGTNPPCRPHHRAASCPADPYACGWDIFSNAGCNYNNLIGALVGGPGPTDAYKDTRQDYIKNEVAIDYNAGFTGALAGLAQSSVNWKQCVQSNLTVFGPKRRWL